MQVGHFLEGRSWLYNESKSGTRYRVAAYARDKYMTEHQQEITPHGKEAFITYTPILLRKGAARLYELYLAGELPMKKNWDGLHTGMVPKAYADKYKVVDDQKPRAVLMANTWLTNLGLPAFDPVPGDVVQAGAEIAREAAAGNIFAAKEAGVLSKSVDADGVSSSKTYSASARKISAGESFALALLSQYLGTGQAKIVRG